MTEYIVTSKAHPLYGCRCKIVARADDNPEWVEVVMLQSRYAWERIGDRVLLRQRILEEVGEAGG